MLAHDGQLYGLQFTIFISSKHNKN